MKWTQHLELTSYLFIIMSKSMGMSNKATRRLGRIKVIMSTPNYDSIEHHQLMEETIFTKIRTFREAQEFKNILDI